MSDFNGEQAQGTWTLTVKDTVGGATPAGTLVGWRVLVRPPGGSVCAPFTCGGDPLPGAVPPTLRASRVGPGDVRLTWSAAPNADAYRVWRAAQPDFAPADVAATSGATTVDVPDTSTGIVYFRINAINSCEWQGP
jgi:hypothetical protein